MRILVTGSTGFIGQHTVTALLRQRYTVRGLGRNVARCTALEAMGAEMVRADLRDREAVIEACANCDAVLHIGAYSAPWGKRDDFMAINVGGTASVIAGCRIQRVPRLVYISSPSVIFTGRDHVLLTEDAPYPRHFASVYSQTKKWGEDLVREALADGLQTVILRPKAVFGPGDTSLLPRLIVAAQAGRLPQIGDGTNQVDITYVENVVHASLLALHAKKAVGGVYTITNNEHPRLWDVISDVLAQLGLPARLRRLPLPAVQIAAVLMELRSVITGHEPLLTRYSVAILGRTQTYNISAAQRDLGYDPIVSLDIGIQRTLAALQKELSIHGTSSLI